MGKGNLEQNMRTILLLLAVCSVWLSYAALKSPQLSRSAGTNSFNPFVDLSDYHFRELDVRAKEMRDRLEFMVFAKERAELQAELVATLHQQLGQQPFKGRLWRDLFFVQDGLRVSDEERYWVFDNAKKILKWNERERAYLINRCVVNYQAFKQFSPKLCGELFANLPMKSNVGVLVGIMQVDRQLFFEVLSEEGIDLTKAADK